MYKLKKIFALFLAIVLATSFSTVAFAAEEESGIPENATKHTIELTVEPGETLAESDSGVAPCIWEQDSYTTSYGGTTYTAVFTVPDRYMAYEAYATSSGSGTCYIGLMLPNATTQIAGFPVTVNGSSDKLDWLDVGAGNSYLFKIINRATAAITVTITYYSWA